MVSLFHSTDLTCLFSFLSCFSYLLDFFLNYLNCRTVIKLLKLSNMNLKWAFTQKCENLVTLILFQTVWLSFVECKMKIFWRTVFFVIGVQCNFMDKNWKFFKISLFVSYWKIEATLVQNERHEDLYSLFCTFSIAWLLSYPSFHLSLSCCLQFSNSGFQGSLHCICPTCFHF